MVLWRFASGVSLTSNVEAHDLGVCCGAETGFILRRTWMSLDSREPTMWKLYLNRRTRSISRNVLQP